MVQHADIDHTGITGAGGNVAGDAIWDAAGDLAVGSGANTAAKLTMGAAGGAVSRVNGAVAWNSGTSFPTAATGDRYWRTDLGEEFYYDGTRWLSTTIRAQSGSAVKLHAAIASGAAGVLLYVPVGAVDIWVVNVVMSTLVLTTNTGAHYWIFTANKTNAANADTSLGTTNTSADTHTTWTPHTITVGAVVATATYPVLNLASGISGTPGNLYIGVTFRYRIIAT